MKKPKMPKLDSIQEKKFSEELKELKHLPDAELIKRIDSKRFSLDANSLFKYKPHILAAEEYKRCLSLFERKIPSHYSKSTSGAVIGVRMDMMQVTRSIFIKEAKHQDSLKEIAVRVVRDLFDIPEHVTILPDMENTLTNELDDIEDSPQPFLSLSEEDKKEMRDEIQKRVLLNGLVHGSAMHIWKSAHYIVKSELDRIDSGLMPLYDIYSASISWLMWQMNPDAAQAEIENHGLTQGSNSLEFDEEGQPECTINCHGINFPVLLHEVTKGAMDYLICHGIPKHYSEQQLEYYYSKADAYENEYWHYLLSPTIWNKLIEASDVDTQDVALVMARLSQLSYQELSETLQACIDSKGDGNLKLKQRGII
jgi:hypothetical protein